MIHYSDRFTVSKLSNNLVRFDFVVELNGRLEPSTTVYMTLDTALAVADILVKIIGLPGQENKQ